jgi:hypothetical protein
VSGQNQIGTFFRRMIAATVVSLSVATLASGQSGTGSSVPKAEQAQDKIVIPAEQKPGDSAGSTTPLSPKELREAQIAADTQRLVQLAEELKAEVAKSSKDTLSLQVLKKATEIEKLARSLKERLKHQ